MMKHDPNEILDECIEAIVKRGKTVEDCLRHYGDRYDNLEPLLISAITLVKAADVVPDASRKQQAKARLLTAVERKRWEAAIERLPIIEGPIRRKYNWRIAFRRLAVATAMFSLLGSVAIAMAEDSLPGSPLYPLKLAAEKASVKLAWDDGLKSKLYLSAAKERMKELERVEKDDAHYPELVRAITANVEAAKKTSDENASDDFRATLSKITQKSRAISEDGKLKKLPVKAFPKVRSQLNASGKVRKENGIRKVNDLGIKPIPKSRANGRRDISPMKSQSNIERRIR